MGYTPTAAFALTTYSVSTASTAATDYMTQIDANFIVSQRIGTNFLVNERVPGSARDMTVRILPGWLFSSGVFTEVAAQVTTAFAAPTGAPRIDRVVADAGTGAVTVVTGTEAAAPVAPSLPSGKIPLAQVRLTPGMPAIGASMLTDERIWNFFDGYSPLPADYQEFTTAGAFTWNKPNYCSSESLVEFLLWGGGGGGNAGVGVGGGGGGGACVPGILPASAMSSAVAGVIGVGGSLGGDGGNSSFSGATAYGGRAGGTTIGGAGAGIFGNASARIGGNPQDGSGSDRNFGGGDGVLTGQAGASVYGGGGGGASGGGNNGGRSVYGGGGGGGGSTLGVGGKSILGGNGGTGGVDGSAPGGGGGGSTAGNAKNGAPGALHIWTWR